MARLIDGDALKLEFMENGDDHTGYEIHRVIDKAPTVDAVPVVRCRECKYCSPGLTREERSIPDADLVCVYWDSDGLDANDFCSYGERKGGDK